MILSSLGSPRARLRSTLVSFFAGVAVAATGVAGAASADASPPDPAIWVGSPVSTATWPDEDGCGAGATPDTCSLPSQHHIVYANPDISGSPLDDWAMDLQNPGATGGAEGTPVLLYAAPQDGTSEVTATVQQVRPACASGNPADGGYAVSVALFESGIEIGTVTYAHIDPSVAVGQAVDRWGGQLGTVGNFAAGSCWTGMHVHVEMSSQHNYSCFNGTFAPAQAVDATNFIGFIGGAYASGQRQACP